MDILTSDDEQLLYAFIFALAKLAKVNLSQLDKAVTQELADKKLVREITVIAAGRSKKKVKAKRKH